MKTIRAIVAEDEPVLRAELRRVLAGVWPDLVVCAETEDGIETAHAIEQYGPDVVFLDVEMPGMNGLEVARYASGRCHVVFVTAYDSYAVAAFEQGAVDYVMKPIGADRLALTVDRLRQKLAESPANLDRLLTELEAARAPTREYLRWITVEHGEELRLITLDSVCYFQSDNKYTRVVRPESESLVRWPIRDLIDELDPKVFWQIHRSTVVNVNAVSGVTRDIQGNMRVKLASRRETLPVSRPYLHRFRPLS
jgi:DNA-binding LytR/AlgR family response regulator